MNTIKNNLLYTLLVCVCLLTACEQEEPDAFNFQPYDPAPVYKNPQNPEEPGIPHPRIIREEFPNATAWRITWEDIIYNYEEQRPAYFSTTNGSLYSMSFLNSTSWQNTANVDMSLVEGFITSPSHDDHAGLKYFNRTKSTAFKRTGMSAAEAAVEIFYAKVLAADRFSHFFRHTDMKAQSGKQKAFLAYAFGAPMKYNGKSMQNAHAHMVEKGLNATHFDAVMGHLAATLQELGVADELIAEAGKVAESTRNDVLGKV